MFGFEKSIQNGLPAGIAEMIAVLKKSADKESCLKAAYGIMTSKYRGYRMETYVRFLDIFRRDLDKIWNEKGFIHCTTMNSLMKILLTKSGFFNDDEIKTKWTAIWYISPHQYLGVKLNGRWVNVDIWGHAFGIGLGDYAHGFH